MTQQSSGSSLTRIRYDLTSALVRPSDELAAPSRRANRRQSATSCFLGASRGSTLFSQQCMSTEQIRIGFHVCVETMANVLIVSSCIHVWRDAVSQ